MTRDELSFECYVVVGNALHLLLHGVSAADQQRLGFPMADLQRLHATLAPVRANGMLHALEELSDFDRALLADALTLTVQLAGAQAEHLLGADQAVQTAVMQALQRGQQKASHPV